MREDAVPPDVWLRNEIEHWQNLYVDERIDQAVGVIQEAFGQSRFALLITDESLPDAFIPDASDATDVSDAPMSAEAWELFNEPRDEDDSGVYVCRKCGTRFAGDTCTGCGWRVF